MDAGGCGTPFGAAKQLDAQFSVYEPLPGLHLNGYLTMGENIADPDGLTVALDAYSPSLGGTPAPVLDGHTGEQRVCLACTRAWCGTFREEAIRKQVVSDPHSPRTSRVTGPVRNIDAWRTLVHIEPSDSLYLAPAARADLMMRAPGRSASRVADAGS